MTLGGGREGEIGVTLGGGREGENNGGEEEGGRERGKVR